MWRSIRISMQKAKILSNNKSNGHSFKMVSITCTLSHHFHLLSIQWWLIHPLDKRKILMLKYAVSTVRFTHAVPLFREYSHIQCASHRFCLRMKFIDRWKIELWRAETFRSGCNKMQSDCNFDSINSIGFLCTTMKYWSNAFRYWSFIFSFLFFSPPFGKKDWFLAILFFFRLYWTMNIQYTSQ